MKKFFSPVILSAAGLLLLSPHPLSAQTDPNTSEIQQLQQAVSRLERRVAILEEENRRTHAPNVDDGSGGRDAAALAAASAALGGGNAASGQAAGANPAGSLSVNHPALPEALPGGATINYTLDGYYEYNFNQPPGGVNLLRAYDVTANSFSLNQAAVVVEMAPDAAARRRFGARLDLQFGQATATLQGNPANESRPDVWRNVFQAYGSYIVPAGSGVNLDFGKWASSLGIEGNYTKDQMNYSRSFFFNYLPYYHMGLRVNYPLSSKVTVNYWLVNGAQQTEDVNGFKDELFGFAVQPAKTMSWTINYYYGQEHPDRTASSSCSAPLQPGLCFAPLAAVPDGKMHIFDSYATWQAAPKLTLAGEGDYVIERQWASAAPGESSAPFHVDGGAAYAQYQPTQRGALAARAEYLSDPDGLFSNAGQALKEATGTYKYSLADGFDVFLEYRRDWSNRPYFTTHNPQAPSGSQDTAGMGLVWWYGGKKGSW